MLMSQFIIQELPLIIMSHRVNPLYYVTFTTFTLCASFILFQGFNTTDPVNTISLLCGFLIIFSGVYLLNLSRDDPEGLRLLSQSDTDDDGNRIRMDGVPTDPLASLQTRRSMQLRRSSEVARLSNGSAGGARNSVSRNRLIHSYDNSPSRVGGADGYYGEDNDDSHWDMEAGSGGGTAQYGLADLAGSSDEEEGSNTNHKRTSFENGNGHAAGGLAKAPKRPDKGWGS